MVHQLHISYQAAEELLQNGKVKLNGKIIYTDEKTGPYDNVEVNGELISIAHTYRYFMWHKPAGVECTYNKDVPDNLLQHLPDEMHGMYYLGRLDKASTGLLLFTNDGHLHDVLLHPDNKVPKKYLVTLEKETDETFYKEMKKGVELSGKTAKADEILALGPDSFEITLTQGMNRQIRRMCFKLGNYVTSLHRIRFSNIDLGTLAERAYAEINRDDIIG